MRMTATGRPALGRAPLTVARWPRQFISPWLCDARKMVSAHWTGCTASIVRAISAWRFSPDHQIQSHPYCQDGLTRPRSHANLNRHAQWRQRLPMPIAHIAARAPQVLELQPGESYWWCRCGRSADQPWCDGSHNAAAEFSPIEFTVAEAKKYALCQCKLTATPPFCDGTHKRVG